MDYFAGLDVSVKETSVCIVDDTGKIVRETRVASEPEALLQVLTNTIYRFKRVGLEAGPLSQWLYSVLAEAGLPVICVETRHMRAVLKAQINKTDRNDARGIAQLMRAGLYRPVHVKTLRSQKLRMLLTHRKLLQSKAAAIDVLTKCVDRGQSRRRGRSHSRQTSRAKSLRRYAIGKLSRVFGHLLVVVSHRLALALFWCREELGFRLPHHHHGARACVLCRRLRVRRA
jgi:transposase